MYFADLVLNLAWALFCVSALVYHIRHEAQRSPSRFWNRARRTLAVLVASVSLFPCVSASDDWVRAEYWNATQADTHHKQSDESKKSPEKSLGTLVRLLESLESVQVSLIWVFSVALCTFALLAVEWQPGQDLFVPRHRGRSPPFSFLAV